MTHLWSVKINRVLKLLELQFNLLQRFAFAFLEIECVFKEVNCHLLSSPYFLSNAFKLHMQRVLCIYFSSAPAGGYWR